MGGLGQPAMKLLHALGHEAAGPGQVDRASFVAGALRELSVGLCRQLFYVPCMFGNACKVQWEGVQGCHACAHRRAWVAVEFLLVMLCLPVPVKSM
jgi:hypothetical protein